MCPKEKDEDHKVMVATDISNHEDYSDHDNLTEDENSYMVNREKSVKAST